jgi:hypothetical protein
MTLAYITGGQYVPMVNAQLLAQVIIGGAREEISLDRLMQDAQQDIDREMQQAEAEGVDLRFEEYALSSDEKYRWSSVQDSHRCLFKNK